MDNTFVDIGMKVLIHCMYLY